MLPKPVVEEHSGFLIVRDDFLKGDAKKATAKCGVVSVDESLFPEEVED